MWVLLLLVPAAIASQDFPEAQWSAAPQGDVDGHLLRAHVLFRHGHRVPKEVYPTDPNRNASLWDDGFSQLTAEGRRQGYALGIGLRKRYSAMIPSVRAWRNISTQSSQIARTMMTAAVVLAGLLPPQNTDQWYDINWQPVPIYTRAPELDRTLSSALNCPKLKLLIKEPDHPSENVLKLRKYLTVHTGKLVKSTNAVEKLYTCLEIERQFGLPLPNWTREVYPEPMKSEAGRALGRSSRTTEVARLRAGPLIEELLNFDLWNLGEAIRLYATHDNVLSGLLGAVGLYSGSPPGFVAALALEYRIENNGRVHVQLWWRNEAGTLLRRLKLPHCQERCPLEKFKSLLRPLIPTDWVEECALSPKIWSLAFGERIGWWFTLTTSILVFILFLLAIGYSIYKNKDYELLPDSRNSYFKI